MSAETSVRMLRPATVFGGRAIDNEELSLATGMPAEAAFARTGVRRRRWIAPGESVNSLALAAARAAVQRHPEAAARIGLVLTATASACDATPSVSCQIATGLRDEGRLPNAYLAWDLNAACSGFLFGAALAHDHLQANPEQSVLLIGAEAVSVQVDRGDAATAYLFGDAAAATLLTGACFGSPSLGIRRPLLRSAPDPGRSLHAPASGSPGHLRMDGLAMARNAVREMAAALRAAMPAGLALEALDALVPHPGSKYILKMLAEELGVARERVFETLAETGNTSSASIPIAIDAHWDALIAKRRIALAAFGAGFTSAATLATGLEGNE